MATDPARSAVMRAVKSRDTKPELTVRRAAHALGYRFRLHARHLPGSPDLVFPRLRTAIFVHGCFWHGHDCPRGARAPKANADYWRAKIARNVARDARVRAELETLGWRAVTIWECELRDKDALRERLTRELGSAPPAKSDPI